MDSVVLSEEKFAFAKKAVSTGLDHAGEANELQLTK